jgi:hypothetical protein
MQQGNVELSGVVWDEEAMILQGSAYRPGGEKGNLFLVSPPEYRVWDIRGMSVGKDAEDGSLIIRVPLEFDGSCVRWAVEFCKSF